MSSHLRMDSGPLLIAHRACMASVAYKFCLSILARDRTVCCHLSLFFSDCTSVATQCALVWLMCVQSSFVGLNHVAGLRYDTALGQILNLVGIGFFLPTVSNRQKNSPRAVPAQNQGLHSTQRGRLPCMVRSNIGGMISISGRSKSVAGADRLVSGPTEQLCY